MKFEKEVEAIKSFTKYEDLKIWLCLQRLSKRGRGIAMNKLASLFGK